MPAGSVDSADLKFLDLLLLDSQCITSDITPRCLEAAQRTVMWTTELLSMN